MLDRKHATLEDVEMLEEVPVSARSDAETAACNCPDLCIRDHEHE